MSTSLAELNILSDISNPTNKLVKLLIALFSWSNELIYRFETGNPK